MFLWGSAAALFALPEGTLRGAVLGSLLWRGLTLRLCNMMNVTVSFHSLQHAPILGFTCHALSQRLVFLHAHTHTPPHTHTHAHTHTHTHRAYDFKTGVLLFALGREGGGGDIRL